MANVSRACKKFTLFTFLIGFTHADNSDQLYDSIYHSIPYSADVTKDSSDGFVPCVAMATGDSKTGCASRSGGNIGILQMYDRDTSYQSDRVVMISAVDATGETLRSEKLQKIAGLLVDDTKPPTSYSSDGSCPNKNKGIYHKSKPAYGAAYADCSEGPKWNAPAQDVLEMDFKFPVFRIQNAALIQTLTRCYELTSNTTTGEKCAVDMKAAQFRGRDSSACINRKTAMVFLGTNKPERCHPLQGNNVVTFLDKTTAAANSSSKKVIWLTSRVDTRSMFYELSPGASTNLPLATFIGVVSALAKTKDIWQGKLTKQIVLTTLDGESYDYIGSSSMLQAAQDGAFPMKVDPEAGVYPQPVKVSDIEQVFEIGEITNADDLKFTIHSDKIAQAEASTKAAEGSIADSIIQTYSRSSAEITKSTTGSPLPPSSVHSFKKAAQLTSGSVSGILINDFGTSYKNQFFASRFDSTVKTKDSVLAKVGALSSAIGKTIVKTASSATNVDSVVADDSLIRQLSDCLEVNATCPLFLSILPIDYMPIYYTKEKSAIFKPLQNRYVGVSPTGGNAFLQKMLQTLVVKLLGKEINSTSINDAQGKTLPKETIESNIKTICGEIDSKDHTSNLFQFYDDNTGTIYCYESVTLDMLALSPAFTYDKNAKQWNMAKGDEAVRYSTWTESIWEKEAFGFKYFVVDEQQSPWAQLVGGVMLTSITAFVNYWITKNSNILFAS